MTRCAQVRAVLPGIGLLMAILGVSDPLAGQGAWAKVEGLDVNWGTPKPRVVGESR